MNANFNYKLGEEYEIIIENNRMVFQKRRDRKCHINDSRNVSSSKRSNVDERKKDRTIKRSTETFVERK